MAHKKNAPVNEASFFFTEPWEPVTVRRGDALGLGALADQFADAVAPGFSNRIRDGRWVTILAWCLVKSKIVFDASGGKSVSSRKEQEERYAWLQPLELMWVARTIALLDKEDWKQRSLAGRRRVAPWYEKQNSERFGMSNQQFRAYRQTGTYGGYRRAFRRWPGMTLGNDGWTPGKNSIALSKWLDSKLKGAQLTLGDELSRSAKAGRGKECGWWLNHWEEYPQSGKDADTNTLPRPRNDFSVLPEASLLNPIIFGDDTVGQTRVKIVNSIKKSSASEHIELCQHLSSQFKDDPVISRLYSFSRLADAGIAAMEYIAASLGDKPAVTISEITKSKDAVLICNELNKAAQAWLKLPPIQIRHIHAADRFAQEMLSDSPLECLRSVIEYHKLYGGGLRWFEIQDGKILPLTLPLTGRATNYGFRLWSLCRIAAQCGVLKKMPAALNADLEDSEEDNDDN
ncbi:MAG: hypothetical protein PHI29_04585 [Gallionella sp.]|nr:hypothetical protein [Gallionella sp.]